VQTVQQKTEGDPLGCKTQTVGERGQSNNRVFTSTKAATTRGGGTRLCFAPQKRIGAVSGGFLLWGKRRSGFSNQILKKNSTGDRRKRGSLRAQSGGELKKEKDRFPREGSSKIQHPPSMNESLREGGGNAFLYL